MKTHNALRHVVYKIPTERILTDLEPILDQAYEEAHQLAHVLVLPPLEDQALQDQVHLNLEELTKNKLYI
jgi:hypothetical protein